MTSKTIIVWGQEDLLSTSVELLLMTQKEWNVVSVSDEEKLDVLIKTVDKVKPDVVIIPQWNHADSSNLPTILLQDYPGLKVITVSANNNSMEVYSKQDIFISSASDLISAVEADPIKLARHLDRDEKSDV